MKKNDDIDAEALAWAVARRAYWVGHLAQQTNFPDEAARCERFIRQFDDIIARLTRPARDDPEQP